MAQISVPESLADLTEDQFQFVLIHIRRGSRLISPPSSVFSQVRMRMDSPPDREHVRFLKGLTGRSREVAVSLFIQFARSFSEDECKECSPSSWKDHVSHLKDCYEALDLKVDFLS
jgi:hypothetical protein